MSATAQNIWKAAQGELELSMARETYNAWLRDAHLVTYEDGEFVIAVRNVYAREWLDKRLKTTITRVLGEVAGRTVQIRFVVMPPEDAPDLAAAGPLLATASQAPANVPKTDIRREMSPPAGDECPQNGHLPGPILDRSIGESGLLAQLSGSAARAYLVLLTHAGQGWLTVRAIISCTGMKRQTAYQALEQLSDLGAVECELVEGQPGKNYYRYRASTLKCPQNGHIVVVYTNGLLKESTTTKEVSPKRTFEDDLPPEWQAICKELASLGVYSSVIEQIFAKRQADPPETVRETIAFARRTGKGPGWLANTLRAERLIPLPGEPAGQDQASWIAAGALS